MAAPDSSGPREITVRVVVLGLVLSVVMGAANVYIGLKAGMTVSASIPAAVVAMLLFRMFFRDSSILEANQVQTCASAGESLAAGIIFTMPALILIGYWTDFDYWTVTGVAFTGGLLGVLLMIPMRRVFVVDNDELPFPEGVACASVLEAGRGDAEDGVARGLVLGAVLGAVFKVLVSWAGLFRGALETATSVGGRIAYYGADISPMLVAVGFIVRLNVALLIFIGGVLGWLVGIPLLGGAGLEIGADPVEGAWSLWKSHIRYLGVGAMVVGGAASIVRVRGGLRDAVLQLARGFRKRGAEQADRRQRDLPGWVIVAFGLLAIVLVAWMYRGFTGNWGVTALSTGVMLVMAFFLTAVASYIVGLVGSSNSPVSGMTITAVLFAGGMLWLFDYSGMEGMVATLGVAAVVCCVACTSGDVCNDLKTGSLLGASPFRQQIMQVAGVAVASLVMAPVLMLLHHNTPGGIGGRELSAPQAGLFASLAEGFSGVGTLPWDMIGIGAGLGVVILIVDAILQRSGSSFRAHLMPIAVGIYLPFGLATPILLGGLLAHFATRRAKSPAEEERLAHRGILFSSGVIAGEALMGVGVAALSAVGLSRLELGLPATLTLVLTVGAAAALVFAFARRTRPE